MESNLPKGPMKHPLVVAVAVFVIWFLITMFGPGLQIGSRAMTLNDLVSHAIALWLAAACIFLFAVVTYLGWWRQVGWRAPEPKSWRLTWFPCLVILLFLALAAHKGFAASQVVMLVLVNTLFVGISEELMTRGVLFHGVLSRFGIWSAIVIVSVLFGAMHLGNVFITGDIGAAAVQAVAAAMSGMMFMAFRLRANSLIPGIVVHWLWDFSVFMAQLAGPGDGPSEPEASLTLRVALPIAFVLPGFLYGLWLLRHIGKRDKNEFLRA